MPPTGACCNVAEQGRKVHICADVSRDIMKCMYASIGPLSIEEHIHGLKDTVANMTRVKHSETA